MKVTLNIQDVKNGNTDPFLHFLNVFMLSHHLHLLYICQIYMYIYFLTFYLFIFRKKEREKEKERNMDR